MISANEVKNLPTEEFWIYLIVASVILLIALWAFVRYFKYARLIEDTPTSKIRSAAQGFVELEGRGLILGDSPITAPLSQKPCLWYKFSIEKKRSTGKETTWDTIESGESPHPILMDDNTGQCILKTKGASIHTSISDTWQGTQRYPTALSIERQDSLLQFGDYRYTEKRIPEGSPIYALGHFKTTRSSDSYNKNAAISQIISEWKADYQSLLSKFDKNQDGTLDEKEWKLVRLAAKLEADDLHKQLINEPEIHTMEKPIKGLPYFISTDDQKGFARKFKWYSAIALVVFLVACYATAWMLQSRGIL